MYVPLILAIKKLEIALTLLSHAHQQQTNANLTHAILLQDV
jgi:hypothetical protein